MPKRWLMYMWICAICVGCAAPGSSAPPPPIPTKSPSGIIVQGSTSTQIESQLATLGSYPRIDEVEFGVVSHLFYTDRNRVMTLAEIAGFDWVRQQIHWKDIEASPGVYYWDEVDKIIEDTAGFNVKLMISIVQAPDFYEPKHQTCKF